MPAQRLIRKLRLANRLSADDIKAIEALPIRQRTLVSHTTIVAQGERPVQCCLVLEGFAFRARVGGEGKRQIVSLHLPGDIPDLQSLHLRVMDSELQSVGRATVGLIHHDDMRRLCKARPSVADALWRETLIDAAKYREWLFNLGQRDAVARMAFLVAELTERLGKLGFIDGESFHFPLTQYELADCLGITPVHANRVAKTLRERGLAEFRRGEIRVINIEHLRQSSGFDPLYLHQDQEL